MAATDRSRGARPSASALLVASELFVGLQVVLVIFDTDLGGGTAAATAGAVGTLVAASAWLTWTGGRWGRGTGALLSGLVGLPAGAAHAQWLVAGVPPAALMGAATVVVALALLVAGSILLVGAAAGWWRLLAIPIGFAVLQFILLPLSMAAIGTHPARLPFTAATPAGAEVVSIRTDDGVELAAWYTPSRNGAAVVLLHGAGGSKADTTAHAAVLARNGYAVLALDARGGGGSGGRGMLWGWHGNRDLAAAVTYLASRLDVDPVRIGAVGLSMGGEQAITAAAADSRIRAVVAEGASARTPDDVRWLDASPQGLIQQVFYPLMWGAADLLTDAAPPISLADAVVALGSRRLLLIESNDPTDAAAGPILRDAAPGGVELWAIADAGHTQGLAVHPGEWESRVIGFLDANLGSND